MQSEISIIRQSLESRNMLHAVQSEIEKWKHRTNMERGYRILASRMRYNSIPKHIVSTITAIMSYLRNDRNITEIDVDDIIDKIRPYLSDNSYSTY